MHWSYLSAFSIVIYYIKLQRPFVCVCVCVCLSVCLYAPPFRHCVINPRQRPPTRRGQRPHSYTKVVPLGAATCRLSGGFFEIKCSVCFNRKAQIIVEFVLPSAMCLLFRYKAYLSAELILLFVYFTNLPFLTSSRTFRVHRTLFCLDITIPAHVPACN